MHLAVTEKFVNEVAHPDLLRLGAVLVDAAEKEFHFRAATEDGRRTIDLSRFRREYGDRLLNDDFCLGLYLHLVQDLVYRGIVYGEYGWNPRIPGNVERIYNDYRLLNARLVAEHGLRPLTIPEDLRAHPLLPARAETFLKDMESQFEPYDEGEFFFLTPAMCAEFVDRAAALCRRELDALRAGLPGIDPFEYAYRPAQ